MPLLYLVTALFIITGSGLPKKTLTNNVLLNNILLSFLFILFAIGINNIKVTDYTDLVVYNGWFQSMRNLPFSKLATSNIDPFFAILMWAVANLFGTFKTLLLFIWIIIFINYTKAIKLIFDTNETVFVLFSFINFFLFFSYVLNVMRQGLAISYLILAVGLLLNHKEKRNYKFYICIIVAPLFHRTAIYGSLVLLLLKSLNITLKTVVNLWIFFIFLFVTGLNRTLSFLPIEDIDLYTSSNVMKTYSATNRLDFLMFSVLFGVIGIYFYKKISHTFHYETLLKFYLLMNILFLALGFIGYSDRLAGYSWLIIPLLMWKGIEKSNQYRIHAFFLLNGFVVLGILMGTSTEILAILQLN